MKYGYGQTLCIPVKITSCSEDALGAVYTLENPELFEDSAILDEVTLEKMILKESKPRKKAGANAKIKENLSKSEENATKSVRKKTIKEDDSRIIKSSTGSRSTTRDTTGSRSTKPAAGDSDMHDLAVEMAKSS